MTDAPLQRPRSRLGRARGAAGTAAVAATALALAAPAGAQGVRVSRVARGLEIPWELAFLPDGRALVTERPGRVRVLSRYGRLRRGPLARVAVSALGEGGLLGLALDPAFARNRFVYALTSNRDGRGLPRPGDDRILRIVPLRR